MSSLFVSSLPFGATDELMRKLFTRFGMIKSIELFADWQNPTFEPYAIIHFEVNQSGSEIEQAISEMDGLKIGSTHLRVHEA